MDGSLSSILMNPSTAQSWPPCNEESPEELQYRLLCASMELQNAKAAAEAEEKIQQAKLSHLQELLSIIQKERDDAREECRKLQVCLSRQGSLSVDSPPCSLMASPPSMVSSPSSSPPWSLHELEEHLNSDDFCDFPRTPAPIDLQQALQSFSQSFNEGLQALFSIEPTCERVREDSDQQQFSLEVLEEDLSFDTDPSLNLSELEKDDKGSRSLSESSQPTRSLSRQSSSNSSSASAQSFHSQKDPTEVSTPTASRVSTIAFNTMDAQVVNNASFPVCQSANNSNDICVVGNLPLNASSPPPLKPSVQVSACTEVNLSMKSSLSHMQAFAGMPVAAPTAKQQASSMPLRQMHLPEPPEADPQVMLSSLPEKGKLLQAVMQAGPLLQTLLLAGPLPQWRHPPPALNTGDIPKVSMVRSKVMLPYPSLVPASLMQGHHVQYQTPISSGGMASTSRVRVANADPCSRAKKLRKLSPALTHQNQLMHMVPREGMVGHGVSYPPSIY